MSRPERPKSNLSNDASLTKAEEILRFIADSRTGRTLREIQTWLIRRNFDRDWTPADRGYYCTNLTGYASMCAGKGLLQKYCKRTMVNENGKRRVKWVVTKPIVGPWYAGTIADPTRNFSKAWRNYYNECRTAKERRQMIETSNDPARLLRDWTWSSVGSKKQYIIGDEKEFKDLIRIIMKRGK